MSSQSGLQVFLYYFAFFTQYVLPIITGSFLIFFVLKAVGYFKTKTKLEKEMYNKLETLLAKCDCKEETACDCKEDTVCTENIDA